jgi:hypothetical protein
MDEYLRRIAQTQRTMVPGTLGGRVRSAAPAATHKALLEVHRTPASATGGNAPDIVFHQPGSVALSPTDVGRFRFRRAVSGLYIISTLAVAGTSNTVTTFYKNGVSIGTATLGNGDTDEVTQITAAFDGVDDYLTAKVTTVGTGVPKELVHEVWGVG